MVLDFMALKLKEKVMRKIMTQIGKYVLVPYLGLKHKNIDIIICIFLFRKFKLF